MTTQQIRTVADDRPSTGGNGTVAEEMREQSTAEGTADAEAPGDSSDRRLLGHLRADVVRLEAGAVGVIEADRAELRNAVAGIVFASQDVSLERGGARTIVAARDVHIDKAGAGFVLAGAGAEISTGGAGVLASLGEMKIEQGGACCLAAGTATVGRGAIVGIAITPRLEVAEGGRVFGGPAAAFAAIAGAVVGLIVGRRMIPRPR